MGQAPDDVRRHVEQFDRNIESYRKGSLVVNVPANVFPAE